MKLIVALGNPGDKYEKTRHNVGFLYADKLVNKWGGSFSNEHKFTAQIAKCSYGGDSVWIVKPQTYMNLSGKSLIAILTFYKLDPKGIFVVYDDIAMNLGALRFRSSGSAGGHNGIKSIVSVLSSQIFDRLKIGIGPQPKFMPSESFVLQEFSKEEIKALDIILDKAVSATEHYLTDGLNSAQSKFNCK